MNATIGIYDTHDLAVDAVANLKESGYPVKQLSIMGLMKTEVVDEKMHVMEKNPLRLEGLGIGTVAGTTLGILTGIGVFAVPGFGLLFGAGAVIGAIAGFDVGLLGGGVVSALETIGVRNEHLKKYHDALVAGKFIVIAHGSAEQIEQARTLLNNHGTHEDIEVHS